MAAHGSVHGYHCPLQAAAPTRHLLSAPPMGTPPALIISHCIANPQVAALSRPPIHPSMVHIAVADTLSSDSNKMPASGSTSSYRKARCPKCTALLTETSTLVYECPSCSTLLLARGSPAVPNSSSLENRQCESRNETNSIGQPGPIQGQLGMGLMEQEQKLLEKNNGALLSNFSDKIKLNVWQDVLLSMLDGQPPAGNKHHSLNMFPMEGLVSKSNEFPSDMPLYSYHRRPTNSSTASGENIDESKHGRHFFSTRGLASFTGPESEFHSENVEMSEVASSKGQTEGSSLNENHCEHISNLGLATSDPNVVNNGRATQQGEVDHVERHCVKLWSQSRGTLEEASYANVRLDTRVDDEEKLGISRDIFSELGHTRSDSDDNNRHLTELSFRIESSRDLGFSFTDQNALEMVVSMQTSVTGPNAALLGNDSEGMTNHTSNYSESIGKVSKSDSRCENEMPLKEKWQNADAGDSNSTGQDDKGDDKNWDNAGLWNSNSNVWEPESNRIGRDLTMRHCMPSEGFNCVEADCVDEKLMVKSSTIAHGNSSCKDPVFPTFLEGSRRLLLGRESQSQAFSLRNNYESNNANLKGENGAGLVRPITPLWAAPSHKFLQRNEGETAQTQVEQSVIESKAYLYKGSRVKEGMALSQRHEHGVTSKIHAYQKVLQSDTHLYEAPYLDEHEPHTIGRRSYQVNDGLISPRIYQRQDDEGNAFACKRDYVDLHETALNRDTQRRFFKTNSCNQVDSLHENRQESGSSLQGQLSEAEGNAWDRRPGYAFLDPSCRHYHYHARPQELKSHFHPNEQYLGDSSGLPLPPSNRAYSSQMAYHNFMVPTTVCQKDFSHLASHSSTTPARTFCNQQSYMQVPPHMPQQAMQHSCAICFSQQQSMAHKHVLLEPPAHHREPTMYKKCPTKQTQTGCHLLQSQGQIRSTAHLECSSFLARKQKHYPPLPGPGAAPYVLCQGCYRMLQVPAYLPIVNAVQKLRCGACGKTSKFCSLQADNRLTIKRGSATNSAHTPYPSHCSNTCKPQLVVAAGLGGSGLHPQHKRVDNQKLIQANTSAMAESTTEKFDNVCHPRPTTTILQGQGLFESQWRHGECDRFLNSAELFHEGYLSPSPSNACGSTPVRNTAGHCTQEHQNSKALRSDRVGFGLKKISLGFPSQSALLQQDGKAFEAHSFADGFFQKGSRDSRLRVSPAEVRGSTHEYLRESCSDEPSRKQQPTLKLKSRQYRSIDADLIRSNSKNNTQQLPVAPGSRLFEHLAQDIADIGSSLQQRHLLQDSNNGIRSTPWSPAPGSALYDHLSYDAASDFDEDIYQKESNAGMVGGEPSIKDVSRGSKYLPGLLKKKFQEFGKGGRGNNNRRKVVVNGHMIPDAAVKRAQEQAGTIYPGTYWYDYQAGFWGVIGGPCLGIIPPFIEEFKFPLAKDSAGGMTGVFVNGRELHKKDLDVLAGRGLPSTPGKAYMVDISGQVVDNASGQWLKGLGRLAPTYVYIPPLELGA